jgi:hypothetical protein
MYGFPDGAARILAQGFFGDAAARARALAVVDAYLAGKPRVMSAAAPWALMLLDQPQRALEVAQLGATRSDALFFTRLWSPGGDAARRLPQFAEFARKTGLAELWDQYGPADGCRRLVSGDYACR